MQMVEGLPLFNPRRPLKCGIWTLSPTWAAHHKVRSSELRSVCIRWADAELQALFVWSFGREQVVAEVSDSLPEVLELEL